MISRRGALAGLGAGLASAPLRAAQSPAPSAREVFASIRTASGQRWDPNATDDRIIFGDRAAPVTGIATCFTASLDVLQRARAAGLNYIIPHEASFFERYDDIASSLIPDDDVVLTRKQRFLSDNRMVIQRMHSHAHARPGDAIMQGLLRQLRWETFRVAGHDGPPWVVLPRQSAGELGRYLRQRLGRRSLRMLGDPERPVSTVSISAGMPGENAQIQQLESGADAIVLGEVREPEVLGYAQDMAARQAVTVYLVGHTGEDAGMELVADWLQGVFPRLPVRWLPLADPFSNPV